MKLHEQSLHPIARKQSKYTISFANVCLIELKREFIEDPKFPVGTMH